VNPTVSQHRKILKGSGFILEEKEVKWVNYLINSKPTDPGIFAVLSSLDFRIADPGLIIRDKKIIDNEDKNVLCK
jgi:hypothetical protein